MIGIDEIIRKAGGAQKLADALGITRPAVVHWKSRKLKTPPIQHAEIIEIVTGIPKEEIWVEHYQRLNELKKEEGNS